MGFAEVRVLCGWVVCQSVSALVGPTRDEVGVVDRIGSAPPRDGRWGVVLGAGSVVAGRMVHVGVVGLWVDLVGDWGWMRLGVGACHLLREGRYVWLVPPVCVVMEALHRVGWNKVLYLPAEGLAGTHRAAGIRIGE